MYFYEIINLLIAYRYDTDICNTVISPKGKSTVKKKKMQTIITKRFESETPISTVFIFWAIMNLEKNSSKND